MKKKLCALGSLAVLVAAPVFADDCASLETALDAAPQQMRSLKQGRYDPDDPDAFNTPWRFAHATEDDCMVTYDEDDGYDVGCSYDASSLSEARDMAEEMFSTVESCLKDAGRRYRATPVASSAYVSNSYRGEFIVEYSDKNDIEVNVSGSCYQSRRRGERCSSHIKVELIGDERP